MCYTLNTYFLIKYHAEGTNSSYREKFVRHRLRLSVFLVHFQEIHFGQQSRIRELLNGSQPKVRRPQDVQRDENLVRFQDDFTAEAVNLTANNPPTLAADLDELILRYIDRCQRLVM